MVGASSRDAVRDEALSYLRAGTSVGLRGLPGAGRSTLLRAIAEALEASGWQTARVAGNPALAAEMAAAQYDGASTMTDRQGALMVLTGLDSPQRTHKLIDFYNRFEGDALVIDKWFSLQASSLHPHALEHVKALAQHPDFNIKNPNRVRSLYMAFAGNPAAFHAADGEGYRVIADLILALDPINASTAARFVTPLGRWRRLEPGRAALMRGELERIAAQPGLSRDTFEQVTRSLA